MSITIDKLNIQNSYYSLGGEKIKVSFNEVRLLETNNIGNFKGHIDIIYPFAGMDLNLTLEMFNEECEYGGTDIVFKLPFVEEKVSLNTLYRIIDYFEEMDFMYDKCSCGGHMLPMYEEHPSWITFCNKCDSRTEDTSSSPLPY